MIADPRGRPAATRPRCAPSGRPSRPRCGPTGRTRAPHPGDAPRLHAGSPGPYYRRTLWLALDDDRVVGGAELGGSSSDNGMWPTSRSRVLPGRAAPGVGRALHDEAVRRARETTGAPRSAARSRRRARGRRGQPRRTPSPRRSASSSVHLEDHLVLRLPRDQATLTALRGSVADRAAGYDVVTWGDSCPDEYVAGYCAMKTQMSNDVPTGEIDYEPIVYDEARLRSSEDRTVAVLPPAGGRGAPRGRDLRRLHASCTCRTARPTSSRTTPWSCPSTADIGSAPSSSWPPRPPPARPPAIGPRCTPGPIPRTTRCTAPTSASASRRRADARGAAKGRLNGRRHGADRLAAARGGSSVG